MNVPALKPLHPPRDETPEKGSIYEKRSTTKTTNAPRIQIVSVDGKSIKARPLNFIGKYGWKSIEARTMRTSTLIESWRKLS